MGLPARKIDTQHTRTRKSHLSVVPPASRRPAPKRRSSAAAQAACLQAFQMFTIVAAVVALLGIGRVWLSVQAAEASMKANEMRSAIKTQRYEGDMLEVRQSALGSPSRIRAIAGAAFDMAPAGKATYVDLSEGTEKAAPVSQKASAKHSVVADVLDLAAGEARVLLVGDVGLASSQ